MSSNETEAAGLDRLPLPRRQYGGPWSRRAVIFVSCALAMNALIGERGLAATLRARQQVQQTTDELTRLKRQNADLRRQASHLKTDLRTIESIARAELGLIRKGEVLVILKDLPAR